MSRGQIQGQLNLFDYLSSVQPPKDFTRYSDKELREIIGKKIGYPFDDWSIYGSSKYYIARVNLHVKAKLYIAYKGTEKSFLSVEVCGTEAEKGSVSIAAHSIDEAAAFFKNWIQDFKKWYSRFENVDDWSKFKHPPKFHEAEWLRANGFTNWYDSTPPKPGIYEWVDIEAPEKIKRLRYSKGGVENKNAGSWTPAWWREYRK
jgi:hypothetical protein